MDKFIPTSAEVRAALEPLTLPQLQTLADNSGVPFTTLKKIKSGETDNPRIETVRQFFYLVRRPIPKRKSEVV